MERHIVAMGGDAGDAIYSFILGLARRQPPRLCWVGTAGKEDAEWTLRVEESRSGSSDPHHPLARPPL